MSSNNTEYIETIFNVFLMVNKKATDTKDRKLTYIALAIYNYVLRLSKDAQIDLKTVTKTNHINMVPFFEYVSKKEIQFLDFDNIDMADIDVSKNDDIERFILSHIYYITQQ